jgi:hypothetical protein
MLRVPTAVPRGIQPLTHIFLENESEYLGCACGRPLNDIASNKGPVTRKELLSCTGHSLTMYALAILDN